MLSTDVWFFDQAIQSVSGLPHPLISNGILTAYFAVVCVNVLLGQNWSLLLQANMSYMSENVA